ncbi:MAG: hypothetical protein NVSMB42_20620 [Herpetosiphon sp.]
MTRELFVAQEPEWYGVLQRHGQHGPQFGRITGREWATAVGAPFATDSSIVLWERPKTRTDGAQLVQPSSIPQKRVVVL